MAMPKQQATAGTIDDLDRRAADMARAILSPASLSLMMFVGCAVPAPNSNESPVETVSVARLSSDEITHRLDYWREEAMELHGMAVRREREAELISKKGGSEEFVTHMRALARQLHAAAEYADQEAQRQAQHAMTQ